MPVTVWKLSEAWTLGVSASGKSHSPTRAASSATRLREAFSTINSFAALR